MTIDQWEEVYNRIIGITRAFFGKKDTWASDIEVDYQGVGLFFCTILAKQFATIHLLKTELTREFGYQYSMDRYSVMLTAIIDCHPAADGYYLNFEFTPMESDKEQS